MAAPAYATDLTDINTNNVFTTADGWGLQTEGGGGQNAITAPELDDFIQGTRGVSRNPFSSSVRGITFDNGATVTVATDDAVYYWWKADVAQALDTIANGGVHLTAGTGVAVYRRYPVAGKDTYAKGGWRCTPIDVTFAGGLADRGSPGSPPYDWFGVMFDIPADGPSKGFPFKMDMIRHGRSVDVTAGDSGDPATWDKLTAHSDDITRQWGIVQGTDTGAVLQGIINWGTAATAVYSRDSNRAIALAETFTFVVSDFTQIVFNNASTDVEWNGISITALDSENKGLIDINNNAAVALLGCVFTGIDTTADGGTNTDFTGSTWINSGVITGAGGTFVDTTISGYEGTADTAVFEWDVNDDGDGTLDGMSFTKGTAATHAIELGASTPTSITLNDWTVSGYNATDGQNDSVILNTSGKSITVNVIGGSGTFSFKNVGGGSATTIVANPVTLSIEVLDITTGLAIPDARVLVEADSGGDLAVGTDIIDGSTNASGIITDTRTYTNDQPITGRVRRATPSLGDGTLYRTSNIVGTVSSANGLSITVQMIPDE